jgi:hypothetical protein
MPCRGYAKFIPTRFILNKVQECIFAEAWGHFTVKTAYEIPAPKEQYKDQDKAQYRPVPASPVAVFDRAQSLSRISRS